jgi:hypothetical protein
MVLTLFSPAALQNPVASLFLTFSCVWGVDFIIWTAPNGGFHYLYCPHCVDPELIGSGQTYPTHNMIQIGSG